MQHFQTQLKICGWTKLQKTTQITQFIR